MFNPYKFSGHITGYCLALHQGKTIGLIMEFDAAK